MRLFRQLGTWGTFVVFAPLAWLLACFLARGLAQHAYDRTIVPKTRTHRLAAGIDIQRDSSRPEVKDPKTLTELQKYVRVWSLEPGACEEFPDAARFPWCWNPFRPSALMLRLKQKQAFLMTQRHEVRREPITSGLTWFHINPDPGAALGGRRFFLETEGTELKRAIEL